MRKGCLFRASKLNYPEIGDTRAAAQPLLATGWVEADPVIALDELFEQLLKGEIAQAFHLTAPLKAARKAEQLEALREQHAETNRFPPGIRLPATCCTASACKRCATACA